MQFTKAVASDFEAIKQLYWNLIDKSSREPSFPGWKKGEHPSDEMITTSIDQGQMFLLKESDEKEDDKIVACAVCNFDAIEEYKSVPWQITDRDADRIWILHALAVDYDHRGQGVGSIFIQELLKYARENGIQAIHFDVIGHNKAAEQFYLKAGFHYVCSQKMYYEVVGEREFMMFEWNLV